jgi:nitrogenase molybdenum-iron protein beta chain
MSDHFIERSRYLCALGGAAATVTAIPGAIPILHSASGCAGNFAWTQNGGSGLQVGGYCGALTTPSSNIQEHEVVFGGDGRLREQVVSTLKVMAGELFVVLTGCVPEKIGDDIKSVVAEFSSEGASIIGAETGGFRGNSYCGYDLVLQALFRDVVEKSSTTESNEVNFWGNTPYGDPFWRGNLEGVRRLLEQLGLQVNSLFTTRDNLDGIRQAGSAALNIVVSEIYGLGTAALAEERHGIPFLSLPLPIGPTATEAFLRAVAAQLGLSTQQVEEVIAREKSDYFKLLEPLTDCWNDLDLQRYAVVVGDANYAGALTRFLADDLGWLPELTVCTDPLQTDEQQRLTDGLSGLDSGYEANLVFEIDASQVIHHLREKWPAGNGGAYNDAFSPAFVVGSSLERELSQTLGAGHL